MVSMGEPARLDLQAGAKAERMLGVTWDPDRDSFKFKVVINLSILKNKSRIGPNLTNEDLMTNPPLSITRRQYYSQVQSLFAGSLGFGMVYDTLQDRTSSSMLSLTESTIPSNPLIADVSCIKTISPG